MFQNIDWVVPRGATTQTLGPKAMEGTNMAAEEKKKVAVDFLRLAGQGHPREMQGVLKAGGIHHNVYVQRGWDALLTAMEEAGKKPPKRPDPAPPEFMFSYAGRPKRCQRARSSIPMCLMPISRLTNPSRQRPNSTTANDASVCAFASPV